MSLPYPKTIKIPADRGEQDKTYLFTIHSTELQNLRNYLKNPQKPSQLTEQCKAALNILSQETRKKFLERIDNALKPTDSRKTDAEKVEDAFFLAFNQVLPTLMFLLKKSTLFEGLGTHKQEFVNATNEIINMTVQYLAVLIDGNNEKTKEAEKKLSDIFTEYKIQRVALLKDWIREEYKESVEIWAKGDKKLEVEFEKVLNKIYQSILSYSNIKTEEEMRKEEEKVFKAFEELGKLKIAIEHVYVHSDVALKMLSYLTQTLNVARIDKEFEQLVEQKQLDSDLSKIQTELTVGIFTDAFAKLYSLLDDWDKATVISMFGVVRDTDTLNVTKALELYEDKLSKSPQMQLKRRALLLAFVLDRIKSKTRFSEDSLLYNENKLTALGEVYGMLAFSRYFLWPAIPETTPGAQKKFIKGFYEYVAGNNPLHLSLYSQVYKYWKEKNPKVLLMKRLLSIQGKNHPNFFYGMSKKEIDAEIHRVIQTPEGFAVLCKVYKELLDTYIKVKHIRESNSRAVAFSYFWNDNKYWFYGPLIAATVLSKGIAGLIGSATVGSAVRKTAMNSIGMLFFTDMTHIAIDNSLKIADINSLLKNPKLSNEDRIKLENARSMHKTDMLINMLFASTLAFGAAGSAFEGVKATSKLTKGVISSTNVALKVVPLGTAGYGLYLIGSGIAKKNSEESLYGFSLVLAGLGEAKVRILKQINNLLSKKSKPKKAGESPLPTVVDVQPSLTKQGFWVKFWDKMQKHESTIFVTFSFVPYMSASLPRIAAEQEEFENTIAELIATTIQSELSKKVVPVKIEPVVNVDIEADALILLMRLDTVSPAVAPLLVSLSNLTKAVQYKEALESAKELSTDETELARVELNELLIQLGFFGGPKQLLNLLYSGKIDDKLKRKLEEYFDLSNL